MDQSFGEVYKLYLVSHSVRGHIHQLTTEFIISSPVFQILFYTYKFFALMTLVGVPTNCH